MRQLLAPRFQARGSGLPVGCAQEDHQVAPCLLFGSSVGVVIGERHVCGVLHRSGRAPTRIDPLIA